MSARFKFLNLTGVHPSSGAATPDSSNVPTVLGAIRGPSAAAPAGPLPKLFCQSFLILALPVCLLLTVLFQGCSRSVSGLTPLSFAGPSYLKGDAEPSPVAVPITGEEMWILARGESPAEPSEEAPGSGALLAEDSGREVPMPLKHTDVRASVNGAIGTVEVTQQFLNPYSRKIEAVYVIPLPHNAAVNEFIMTIGERRIRGIIRDRSEATQLYQEARRQGYVASLLTEERPNIFTQRVANIEPGKEIDVNIKYFNTLDYVDGWYEFVFPMVVGPRFNPPGLTDGIGAVARHNAGASAQNTEIEYLRPGERTGHDISLQLDINAGAKIEEFECHTHAFVTNLMSPEHLTVSLAPTDTLPNKDFVFRFRVAGEQIKSSFVTHRDERGGFFSLTLYPPQETAALNRQPLELFFVLDCSGSMSGRPLEEAKAAVLRALHLLQPGDSFQLITFSMTTSSFGERPLEATADNLRLATRYIRSLQAEGGTMMIEGVKAALDSPRDPQRPRFVCFLTDGYVGNEAEILGAIHERLGASRIFSFGIGSSVNRYLIEHMAQVGRGAVAYLGPNDSAAEIMENFFKRISHPALTDLQIDWGGLYVTEVCPAVLPDLFVGRPAVITGRFAGDQGTIIRINGTAAGQPVQMTIPAPTTETGTNNAHLAEMWARMKIAELARRATYQPDSGLPEEIRQLALDYSLTSPFTAFVAVDSTTRTEGPAGRTVPVAVPVPEGVKYKKTVSEK